MNAPLDRKAALVAELARRLEDAFSGPDEDASFLAHQLESEAASLESALNYAARKREEIRAFKAALKEIISAKQERLARLDHAEDAITAAMAHAILEAGLATPIRSPEFTISLRMGKAPLIIDGEPDERSDALDDGSLAFARLGKPAPVLTVRSK